MPNNPCPYAACGDTFDFESALQESRKSRTLSEAELEGLAKLLESDTGQLDDNPNI